MALGVAYVPVHERGMGRLSNPPLVSRQCGCVNVIPALITVERKPKAEVERGI